MVGNPEEIPTATVDSYARNDHCARCSQPLSAESVRAFDDKPYCPACYARARIRTDARQAAEIFFYTTVIVFITSAVLGFSGYHASALVDGGRISAYIGIVVGILAGLGTFIVRRIKARKPA